jgi:4-hydroxybenzoate polyprenyltransferase
MVGVGRLWRTTVALIGACHPVPCVAVTLFTVALAARVHNSVGTCVVVAVAVLAGQLSIGWSNDRIDRALDRSAGRRDKPLARDGAATGVIDRAIAVAVAVTIAASLDLGWRAGLLHLLGVACGWLYNLRLKATVFSWLPYAVAFGSLPGVATLARPGHSPPAWWAVVAGALLGITAHLTNALPDLVADRTFGIKGFPHRMGARPSVALAAVALLAGTAVLVLGPRGSPSPAAWVGLGVAATWTIAGCALAWRQPRSPWIFYGTIALVAVDIALLTLGPTFAT